MTIKKALTGFPPDFLWGAATAAHQVEGNNYNQWSQWEKANAERLAKAALSSNLILSLKPDIQIAAADPNNYISGQLADHYHRYEKDFDFLTKMNLNAYRFSVEWSRIEPKAGQWNNDAIEHYKQYAISLKRRRIEPIITLFHFTLPLWLADKGGFEKRENIKYFVRFAKKIVSELGASLKYIITINEPEVYASKSYYSKEWPPAEANFFKMLSVMNNLAAAHNQAAVAIHKLNQFYQVSIAKSSAFFYPGNNSQLSHLGAAAGQYFQDDYHINKVIKHCDFLGINYYFSNRVYGWRIQNPNLRLSDLAWDMQPAKIQFNLARLYRKYNLPILITENGLADAKDKYRRWWLEQTIISLQKTIKNGVPLIGYLHWSLMDNFEWAYGKWPRFGLVAVDYKTGRRSLRPSGRWFGQTIKQIRGV